jgi:G:T/U-mismatch repair DNA glycosylase
MKRSGFDLSRTARRLPNIEANGTSESRAKRLDRELTAMHINSRVSNQSVPGNLPIFFDALAQ